MSFDERLMAYRLADGQPLWAKPATVDGWIRDIVQHPRGIIMLPEGPPEGAGGNRRVINGVVQTGLNVARYEDGTMIAAKPLRMRGTVMDAMIAGDAVVLAVDADSKTFVNVLDVATATVRLTKDVKIKGRLAYAELTPAGLLYISRSDAATSGEVNIIDLSSGEPKYKDAIEGRKSEVLPHAVDGSTLYVFAPRDRHLYALNRQDGTYREVGGEIKLEGDEDPTGLEVRGSGLVLIAPALATKRFKASLATPGSVFMLTRSPDGNGNVLLQIDKDTAQPRARVDLGKSREPVYAVDDLAAMLFLQTAAGTLVGYRL